MSTTRQLINSDLNENASRNRNYFRSSSLSYFLRHKHMPVKKPYRRDRVLIRIMQMDMEKTVREIGFPNWRDEISSF
ncbi:DUF7301 family protein [Rahnella bonaserana]